MNSSAYIFGNLGGGFTQYPEDYAHEIYEEFQNKADAPSQVIIHRDKSIMYYGYVRKLDKEGQYIGLCVLLNGVMLSKMTNLFTVFEKVVSEMVSQGELIKMDNNGDIIGVAGRLDEKHQEVERIVTYLREEVIHWESTATKLPPISYSISNDSCQTFSSYDKDEDIVAASVKYGYTCVQKNEGYDTPLLAGLRNVLRQKSGVKDSPQEATIDSGIQKKNTKIQQNFWWIAAIIVFVVVCISVVINSIKKTPQNETTGTTLSEVQSDSKLADVSTEATKKVAKEDAIKERLKDFWKWNLNIDTMKNWEDRSKDYFSADFMNLMAKVDLASEINGYDFDGYHGVVGADWSQYDEIGVKILSLSFEGDKVAQASVKVYDLTGKEKWDIDADYKLVYERGKWYIDDLCIKNDIHDGTWEKTAMKEYAQEFCVDTSPNKSPNKKDAYQKYLKKILNECEWYRHREGGFLFPSRTGQVYEDTSEELAGSYLSCFNEWGAVHLNYFVVFGGVVEMPYEGSGLGSGHKVKSITYKNGAGDVFSGLTNDGSVYYLKKHVSISENVPCPSARVLVLIYPRECQDVITPMIDAVNNW